MKQEILWSYQDRNSQQWHDPVPLAQLQAYYDLGYISYDSLVRSSSKDSPVTVCCALTGIECGKREESSSVQQRIKVWHVCAVGVVASLILASISTSGEAPVKDDSVTKFQSTDRNKRTMPAYTQQVQYSSAREVVSREVYDAYMMGYNDVSNAEIANAMYSRTGDRSYLIIVQGGEDRLAGRSPRYTY